MKKQNPTAPDLIRDYRLSGQNKYVYHFWRFANFLRKPSEWKAAWIGQSSITTIDTFSNEFGFEKRSMDFSTQPEMDCLNSCTDEVKMTLLKELQNADTSIANISDRLIDSIILNKSQSIKAVFDRQSTNYKIIITPMIYPLHPSINPSDLDILEEVFCKENIYDYSGNNYITMDWRYFSDPLHFGLYAGWWIIETMYAD